MLKLKITLVAIFSLFSHFFHSQTFEDIIKISSYHGNSFDSFEKGLKITSYDRSSKFGFERKIYKFKQSMILMESMEDKPIISKISFLTNKGDQNQDLWYQATKKANESTEFVLVDSYLGSVKPDLYKKDISYSDLIKYLRTIKDEEKLICYVVFKKSNLYYQFNFVDNTFYLIISTVYEKKD